MSTFYFLEPVNVNLHGQRGFVDVVKDPVMGAIVLIILIGQCKHRVLIKGRQKGHGRERDMMK